ncbi:MAG: uL15 family ribosomal protein [Candidatus Taylorbacteria bacterium]|nr:uL15 family ribosomal protein [Candidatus Taylorbacteria bacterium]
MQTNQLKRVSVIEELFLAGDSITPTVLVQKGLIGLDSGVNPKVKILGDGELTKAFKFSGCLISGSAKAKIEKAGGMVELRKRSGIERIAGVVESKEKKPKKAVSADISKEKTK